MAKALTTASTKSETTTHLAGLALAAGSFLNGGRFLSRFDMLKL
jgi:hypothetical protein